jgi:hypothetical protein
MSLELIGIIVAAVMVVGAFLFFALAKRVVRLAIRLILVFAVILIVVIAALIFTWYGNSDRNTPTNQNRPVNTRRGNSR